ncbi:MAG: ACP S-malonyltransferase [Isosphaeraceae bacterium]
MATRKTRSRARDGRLRLWPAGWLRPREVESSAPSDRPASPSADVVPRLRAVAPGQHELSRDELKQQIGTAAIAFRGYDASNIGRGAELLAHPVYGPVVREMLDRAGGVCADVMKQEVDLAARVAGRARATLDTFVEDTATIVALELAQIRLLEEVFEVPVRDAVLSFGHSIGELSALVLGGVYEMEQLLPIPLALAHDCADLTADTKLGILTSPSGTLEPELVQRLCSAISSRGHGMVGPSTFLSPYQVILLGQADTLDLLEAEMREHLPPGVTLRRRPNQWPPLHTPLVWERSVPNRAAVALYHTGGGNCRPRPEVVSCTTGRASYDEWNSRELLTEWTDHPQRLWDAMENTLASGAELVIHVGPEPTLIPTAFERLSGKVMKRLKSSHLDSLGRRVLPSISRNHWLARKLPQSAVVFRAPFMNHLILEDWLLSQDVA